MQSAHRLHLHRAPVNTLFKTPGPDRHPSQGVKSGIVGGTYPFRSISECPSCKWDALLTI